MIIKLTNGPRFAGRPVELGPVTLEQLPAEIWIPRGQQAELSAFTSRPRDRLADKYINTGRRITNSLDVHYRYPIFEYCQQQQLPPVQTPEHARP